MEKGDKTGIAGVIIGVGAAVAAVAVPWEISPVLRHILFWSGIFIAVLGALWISQVHYLERFKPFVYLIFHAIVVGLFVGLVVFMELSNGVQPPDSSNPNIARIVVTGFALATPPTEGSMAINTHTKNIGPIPSIGAHPADIILISPKKMDDADLDREFNKLYERAKAYSVTENEEQPGVDLHHTAFTESGIDIRKEIEEIKSGRKIMYLLYVTRYRGRTLRNGVWWRMESCNTWNLIDSPAPCATHNHIIPSG